MLISRKHNFIFIHIYKNAGTSIQNALLPFVANRYEKIINQMLRSFDKDGNRFLSLYLPRAHHPVHFGASELIHEIGRDAFDSYFSFAIVRNPWDWQVSLFKYMLREPRHFQHGLIKELGSFDKYIEWRCAKDVRFQKDFVCSKDGDLLVDFVGRYENLNTDFEKICSRIGISAILPKFNISNTASYQQYYNKKTIDLVRRAFALDIQFFNYEYESL